MNTFFTTMHFIDVENEETQHKNIENAADAQSYIRQLMEEILRNESKRKYEPRAETTRVVSQIIKVFNEKKLELEDRDIIALKLLDAENNAQERIDRLGIKIKKGSLIQSLFFENNKYYYLISKVESEAFLDETDLNRKIGLRYEDKAFKNCLIEFEGNDIKEIYISDKNTGGTEYWHGEFLELKEKVNNHLNTETAFDIFEKVINTAFKKRPRELAIHKNQLFGYFENENNFDVEDCLKHVFGSSSREDINIDSIKESILTKTSKSDTDTQFFIEKEAINKKKLSIVKKINPHVTITLNGHTKQLEDNIFSIVENGKKFIKIKVTNDETYETFDWTKK